LYRLRKLDIENLILRFKEVHDIRYDYSLVSYKNIDTPIEITCKKHGSFFQVPYSHLKGSNCPKCSNISSSIRQRSSLDLFTHKSKKVHGDRYSYTAFVYTNKNTDGLIICNKHGPFNQSPRHHLRGHGCPKCCTTGIPKGLDFYLKQFQIKFGNRYSYDLVDKNKEYRTSDYIDVMCKKHGLFKINISNHKVGKGCTKCAIELNAKRNLLDQDYFLQQVKNIQGNKYDYSNMIYLGMNHRIEIICPQHGSFFQTAANHLSGQSCVRCIKVTDRIDFIEQAEKIWGDKYDYSQLIYIKSRVKSKILCLKHGPFEQTPNSHLSGSGCPICRESHGERKIRNFLIEHKIQFKIQHTFVDCVYKRPLRYDFYLPEYNCCIEYDGEQHNLPLYGQIHLDLCKKRDEIKNRYCVEKNIILYRISYKDKLRLKLCNMFNKGFLSGTI
jgi:hypothetical protein